MAKKWRTVSLLLPSEVAVCHLLCASQQAQFLVYVILLNSDIDSRMWIYSRLTDVELRLTDLKSVILSPSNSRAHFLQWYVASTITHIFLFENTGLSTGREHRGDAGGLRMY